MDGSQGKKRQKKDKKGVDLDNLKREVEMVSIPTMRKFTHYNYDYFRFLVEKRKITVASYAFTEHAAVRRHTDAKKRQERATEREDKIDRSIRS